MNDKCKDLQKKKDQPDPVVSPCCGNGPGVAFVAGLSTHPSFISTHLDLLMLSLWQTGKSKKVAGCPFLDPDKLVQLKDHILVCSPPLASARHWSVGRSVGWVTTGFVCSAIA